MAIKGSDWRRGKGEAAGARGPNLPLGVTLSLGKVAEV